MSVSIVLTDQQVQDVRVNSAKVIALTAEQIAVINPPASTPIAPAVGFALPPEVAGRVPIKVNLPWVNGAPRIIADLNERNVWALAFTPKPYSNARLSGAEWQSQQTARQFALVRNSDGAVIMRGSPYGGPSVTLNLVPGIPPPRSGKYQAVPDERYTMSVWNVHPVTSRMFMELYCQ